MNEGDWICPDTNCGNINFARRVACYRCNKERPDSAKPSTKKLGTEIGKSAAEKSRGLFNADDWQCNKCANVNWARRVTCNVCNAPKFGEVEARTGYGGGYNERGVVEYRRREESSDDEFDEFGRRKRKQRKFDGPPEKVWNAWVTKVRTKARKIRDRINGTGGGPALPPPTAMEDRILEISGRAAAYGFTSKETQLNPVDWEVVIPQPSDDGDILAQNDVTSVQGGGRTPSPQMEVEVQEGASQETPAPPMPQNPRRRMRRPARPSRVQRIDPGPLVEALIQNSRLMQESINGLAEAVRGMGEVIGAAIREAALPR